MSFGKAAVKLLVAISWPADYNEAFRRSAFFFTGGGAELCPITNFSEAI